MNSFSYSDNPDIICQKMIPVIAAEPSNIKREILAKYLAQYTTVSTNAIIADVNNIINNKFSERINKIKASTESYLRSVESDPDNIRAHMASHEQGLELIEKEYKSDSIGINYQINRFNLIQEMRANAIEDSSSTSL